MALPLVGDNFRRSQDAKGFDRRNGRRIQDRGPCVEGSRREEADDQRWDCYAGNQFSSAAVLDRFLLEQKQEQEAEQITHNTLASYRSMICQHIRPKWGDAYLWKMFGPP